MHIYERNGVIVASPDMNSLQYNEKPVKNIENAVIMFLQKYGIKPFNLTFEMDVRRRLV